MNKKIMNSIGKRLREERGRMNLSQSSFSGMANTSKHSQINYEKGVSAPNAVYLSAIELSGADTHYILTGRRPPAFTHTTIVYVGDETINVGAWSQKDLDVKVEKLVRTRDDPSAKVDETEIRPDEKPALSKDPATFAKELETALKLISEESARIGWQMPRSMQKGLATIAADGIDQALLIQLVKLLWTECEKE